MLHPMRKTLPKPVKSPGWYVHNIWHWFRYFGAWAQLSFWHIYLLIDTAGSLQCRKSSHTLSQFPVFWKISFIQIHVINDENFVDVAFLFQCYIILYRVRQHLEVLCLVKRSNNCTTWTHCVLVMSHGNRSGSTLAQVMTCYLTAPSHYLNQNWPLIVRFCGIYLRASSQQVLLFFIVSFKIILLKWQPHIPGAKELKW